MPSMILYEKDIQLKTIRNGPLNINVSRHINGFYNGTALCLQQATCLQKDINIVDFFRVRRIIALLVQIGGVDKHRMKVNFKGRSNIFVSAELFPYLAQWLYPEFYFILFKHFSDFMNGESEQDVIKQQQERLALCRKVNIETVDDLNTALSSNRVQQVKILELESAIDQQGSELAEFAARLTQAGYEYRELKDKHDVIYGCYQEGLEIHVKHLEYTHTIELERDDLKERLGLSQVVTTPEDDLQHNKEIQQHNKEIEDIIRDRAEKKKRIIDEEEEKYRLIKEEEERMKMIEEDERRQKIKRMIEEEDLELQECLATKKRKFEQMFIDKVIYKKVN
jgi:hypothetical protein